MARAEEVSLVDLALGESGRVFVATDEMEVKLERIGELGESRHRRVRVTVLDLADLRLADHRQLRQPLLREPVRFARGAQLAGELEPSAKVVEMRNAVRALSLGLLLDLLDECVEVGHSAPFVPPIMG